MPLSAGTRILLCAVLIDLTAKGLSEARSLRRRHGHHLHSPRYDLEESVPRELSLRHLEREKYGRTRSTHRDVLARRNNEMQRDYPEDYPEDYPATDPRDLRLRSGPRRKRHGSVTYRNMTKKDEQDLKIFKQLNSDRVNKLELEVREAQNKSICNYTVYAIPDPRGSRVPSDLEHVRCNHVGSSCQNTGAYCCMQTYRRVKVWYADGHSEMIKVYTGCVCALRMNDDLPNGVYIEKELPIHD